LPYVRFDFLSACFAVLMAMVSVVNAQTGTYVSGADSTSAPPELLESLGIDGLIDVEADGSVSQVTFKNSNLKREIEQRLQDMLLAWRFHPIEVDGQVRNIRSSFRLRLELRRDPDRTWLQVAKYEFGVPVKLDAQRPRYPMSALRDGVGAEILMWVAVRADGSVAEVEPVRGQAFGKRIGSENAHQKALKPFVQSATAAIQDWRFGYFAPAPNGELTHLLVPVKYSLSPSRQIGPAAQMPVLFDGAVRLSTPLADLLSPENRLSSDPAAPISLDSESRIQPLEESLKSTVVL
jgi:hypothetical protein